MLAETHNPQQAPEGASGHPLVQQVQAYCQQHGLLRPGPVVAAVSGGPDSVALLRILLALRQPLGIVVHVASFDHGLRGEESAADVRHVRALATGWGVPCLVGADDVAARAQEWGLGIEAAARRARYRFLQAVAQQVGAGCVATGHNRDDQAETVLLHVLRGSGLRGLRGMLPATPWQALRVLPAAQTPDLMLVRPLLDTPRTAIMDFLYAQGIQTRLDRSNLDRQFKRNRLRLDVMPALEEVQPGARDALARLAMNARDDLDALQSTLPALTPQEGGLAVPLEAFRALAPAQARLLVRLAAHEVLPGAELSRERCEAVYLHGLEKEAGALELSGHLRAEFSDGTLLIYDPAFYPPDLPWLPPNTALPVLRTGRTSLPGSGWTLNITEAPGALPAAPDHEPLSTVLALPASEVARLELRTPHTGDRFRPRGMGGSSQKLSDTLINMKVRAAWRNRIALLTVSFGGESEIAWFVAPAGAAIRARVGATYAPLWDPQPARPEPRTRFRLTFEPPA